MVRQHLLKPWPHFGQISHSESFCRTADFSGQNYNAAIRQYQKTTTKPHQICPLTSADVRLFHRRCEEVTRSEEAERGRAAIFESTWWSRHAGKSPEITACSGLQMMVAAPKATVTLLPCGQSVAALKLTAGLSWQSDEKR